MSTANEASGRADRVAKCVASALGVPAGDVFADGFELQRSAAFSSFALLEMVVRLEEEFGITIPDRDLTLERFSTVESIGAYVSEREREPSD